MQKPSPGRIVLTSEIDPETNAAVPVPCIVQRVGEAYEDGSVPVRCYVLGDNFGKADLVLVATEKAAQERDAARAEQGEDGHEPGRGTHLESAWWPPRGGGSTGSTPAS